MICKKMEYYLETAQDPKQNNEKKYRTDVTIDFRNTEMNLIRK